MSSFAVRRATPNDQTRVLTLVEQTFAASEFGYHGEADIVRQIEELSSGSSTGQGVEPALRHEERPLWMSWVAEIEETLVGHIFYSLATARKLQGKESAQSIQVEGVGLGPMVVHPGHQRQGIGAALIQQSMAELVQSMFAFACVLGHPEYYPRFEFSPASHYGVRHGFAGIPQDVFFIRPLGDRIQFAPDSLVRYLPQFGSQLEK